MMITAATVLAATRTALGALSERNGGFAEMLRCLQETGRVAIVGGAARDWALGRTPRDIDIVVETDEQSLHETLDRFASGRTGLGGTRLTVQGTHCDVWALPKTWGIVNAKGQIPTALESLPRTAFLNVDAVIVEVGRWEVHECRFLDAWRSKRVEVNFVPNPRPAVSVAHMFAVAERYGLLLSATAREYFEEHLEARRVTWKSVIHAHSSRYGARLDSRSVRRLWAASFPETPNLPQFR